MIDYIQELELLEGTLQDTVPPNMHPVNMRQLDELTIINTRITELESERQITLAHANLVFENSRVGQIIVGLNDCFVRVNQRFCDIIQRPKLDILGRTWQEITHPADLKENQNNVNELRENEKSVKFWMRKRYITPEGGIVWVILDSMLIRDKNNRPLFYHGIVEDMTMIAALYNEYVRPRAEAGEHGS